MVNQSKHMQEMKQLMRAPCDRGNAAPAELAHHSYGWNAGAVLPDVTRPSHDWGTIENPKFDNAQLDEMKKECSTHCLSTCNYILDLLHDTSAC